MKSQSLIVLLCLSYCQTQLLGQSSLLGRSSLTDSLLGRDSSFRGGSSLTDSLLGRDSSLRGRSSLLDSLLGRDSGLGLLGSGHSYRNIMAVLRADPSHSVLVRALTITQLADSLESGGPFTLFAPTNQAFDLVGR